MPLKIQTRDPQHLKDRYRPELRRLPELAEDSAEFLAFAATHKRAGFIRPLLVDEHDNVIDDHSRTLLRVALRWQLKEVPVQVRSSLDAPLLLIHSLKDVRHLSKSAIAYLAYPNLEPALEGARMQKLQKLRNNPESLVVASGHYEGVKTVEELAEEIGIDRKTMFEAAKVHKEFADKKKYLFNVQGGSKDGAVEELTLKEFFEPRLLRPFCGGEHEQHRPMGLGGIIAGITAVRAGDRDKFNPRNQGQLNLFENKVDVVAGWKYWIKLTPKEREQHFDNFEDRLEFIPDGQRDELADYFEKLARKVRKSTKVTE